MSNLTNHNPTRRQPYDEGDEVSVTIRHTAWVMEDRGDVVEVALDGEKGRRWVRPRQINAHSLSEIDRLLAERDVRQINAHSLSEIDRLLAERDVLRRVVAAADAMRQANPRPALWHTLDDYDDARAALDEFDLQEVRDV